MAQHQLFTSSVYQAPCLKASSALVKDLKKEVRQIETADLDGRKWSAEQYLNGYTSYGSWDQLHRMSPHFQALQKKIDAHVAKYVRALHFDLDPRELQMSRFWVNVMFENTIHTMHIHPLSVISGTFYLELPPGSSPIKFEDPRFNFFMSRPAVKKSAPQSSQSFVSLHPKAGDVVLFESWMRHEVPLQKSPRPRISCSFNYDWVGC